MRFFSILAILFCISTCTSFSYAENSLSNISTDLDNQIEELGKIQIEIDQNNQLIETLKKEKADLEAKQKAGETLSAEQETKIKKLTADIDSYQNKVSTLMKSFRNALLLTEKYKTALKTSETLNWILGGTTVASLVFILVENLIVKR